MQGTAADIIKRAMIAVDSWLESSHAPARLIMQVHDELILEAADGAVQSLVGQLLTHMSHAANLDVPLKVDVGVGRNWDEAH
jgi:DNA polymerase-1